jgi:very-short-patch-repair endonuclease
MLPETRFTGREPDSDFEVEVAQAIRELGFDVVAQLGVAGFYLDLAVRHPALDDVFILGVECDGATYHSARAARDRDRLRQQILERLNWKIHRIWSTDWYRSRPAAIANLRNRLDEVLRAYDEHQRHSAVRPSTPAVPTEPRVSHSTPHTRFVEVEACESDAVEPRITVDEAKQRLIDLRERLIAREFPDSDRRKGLLRRSMIDMLLARRPTNQNEWVARIPAYERQLTDGRQLVYLDRVFSILAQIADSPH